MNLMKLANRFRLVATRLGIGAGVLSLTACTGGLDTNLTENAIQEEFESAGITLKAVKCPRSVKKAENATFTCTGELENNSSFLINVTQKDDQGNVTWDVPHSKGLLNLAKLETLFQGSLQTELGIQAEVNCGTSYRMVNAGDNFECQVLNQSAIDGKPATGQQAMTDKIVVRVDGDGNVSWQRVLPDVATNKPAADQKPTPGQAKAPAPSPSPEPQNQQPDAEPDARPAPPPAQSGEDFLNQPGAIEDFD